MVSREENVVFELFLLLERAKDAEYFGEVVSQQAHALQAAQLARDAKADDEAVIAALLHDLGHLAAPPEAPRMEALGVLEHEAVGAAFLGRLGFSERVVKLVHGHVAAKRYLARTNARYGAQLSEASRKTLFYQGGPMSAEEAQKFENDPLFEDHLRQRSWDERAKQPGWAVAPLEAYRELLLEHLRRNKPQG